MFKAKNERLSRDDPRRVVSCHGVRQLCRYCANHSLTMADSPILSAQQSNPLQGGPSFSLMNRCYRALWSATWLLLAVWTPSFLFGWRCFLLRLFGAQLARTARVYGSARV